MSAAFQVRGLDRLHAGLAAYERGESRASSLASKAAAEVFAGAAERSVQAAVGADRMLSSINRNASKPAKLDVRVLPERVGRGQGAGWVAKATPGGQWAIVEFGTKPHAVGVGRRNKRKRAAFLTSNDVAADDFDDRARMVIGGNVRTGPFVHPGTRGKHPFRLGVKVAEPAAKEVWRREYVTRSARLLTGG